MRPEPRILVVAPDDAHVGGLCQGLDALGWRTLTARTTAAALVALADHRLEAAVVDGRHPDFDGLPAALKRASAPRRLPVVAIAEAGGAPAEVDLASAAAPHPAQAAMRLEQLVRAAVAEEEFDLRRRTLAAHGATLSLETDDRPLRILVAGKADPRFIALSNAVAEDGSQVVAAPTPYTAFDYLHESAFDAAILWGGSDPAPALSIASGMKRNTRLYHIPLTLYLRSEAELNLSELFNRGFAEIATAEVDEAETARRVLALARAYRRDQAVRRGLDSARAAPVMDPDTGLFTAPIFAAHLSRLADSARERRRPLSVCVLRVGETAAVAEARRGGWLARAMPQIGAMVSRLVRVEDTAARLAPEVFALALPATPGPAARLAAERIAAVIGCTAFDAGRDRTPFVAEFEVGAAEVAAGESVAKVLERASADLAGRRPARG